MAPTRKATPEPELPPNIAEFNTIAGLIFAQLYRAFPVHVNIDRKAIAATFGVGADESVKLKSGQSFAEMLGSTMFWLNGENFITAKGVSPGERVVLSEKGLAAMNAVPSGLGLKQSVGSELVEAVNADDSGDRSRRVGQLVGSVLGNWTGELFKSLAGA